MIVDINNPKDIRSRVWLNGEEVTRWSFYADDELGLVRMWKHDKDGMKTRPRTVEEKRGEVRIERHD